MAVCADVPAAPRVLSLFNTRLLDPVTIEALTGSPLPVLLAVPPEPFEAKTPFTNDTSYTVVLNLAGASLYVWGQSPMSGIEPEYWSPVYGEVDFIQEVTFFTPAGIYTIDLECSAPGQDPRCADSRYLEAICASMALFEKWAAIGSIG